jgi:hypothetical protein
VGAAQRRALPIAAQLGGYLIGRAAWGLQRR